MALARHPLLKQVLPALATRLGHYLRLMRFDRPIGIWLLLWPVLWAVWLASSGRPRAEVFVVFLLGTVLMRAAGCTINDWADWFGWRFRDIFVPKDERVGVLVNFGIAAVVYLIAGRIVAGLIRRIH